MSWDLSSTKSIQEGIAKAKCAFFAFGALGAFNGKLNPLSGRAIYETCVIPVLLYGCENWIMTDTNISILESFQGEIGRRILRLSKIHSILSTRVALQLPSITSRIFSWKLSLLRKVHTESDSLSHKVFSVLPSDSPRDLHLVQECLSLEEKLDCHGITQEVLDGNLVGRCGMAKLVAEADWKKCLRDALDHRSSAAAAEIATSTSWLKLWDMALDHGCNGTASPRRSLMAI